MSPTELRGKRIGIVFAGGGAKGAYQIGCWKALRALGLDDFHAIAGSSVGAMNAVLAGTGRLDAAEAAWRQLRLRDVVGLNFRRAVHLPLWAIAALGSEFSPFKLTRLSDRNGDRRLIARWLHTIVCAAVAAALIGARSFLIPSAQRWAIDLAIVALCAGGLARLHHRLRPIFLSPALTHNGPLADTLAKACTEEDASRLARAGRRVYGVVSCYAPHAKGSHRWGGWAPVYVALDGMDVETLRRTLLAGSAVPGVFAASSHESGVGLDGSWTDNVPTAPLIFGGEVDLDVVFVLYLKQKVRHTTRHNSLCSLLKLLICERTTALQPRDDLRSWAEARWETYRSSGLAGVPAREGRPGKEPLLVPVAPSARVGNFFTGTLWFSPKKSAMLIDLGERDMFAAIQRLAGDADVARETDVFNTPRTRRDRRMAVFGPAPS